MLLLLLIKAHHTHWLQMNKGKEPWRLYLPVLSTEAQQASIVPNARSLFEQP
jgi:hypothetical protein